MIDIEPNADSPAELTDADLDAAAGAASIVSPRDAASGLPTGKRQHKPFTAAPSSDSATSVDASQTITYTGLE